VFGYEYDKDRDVLIVNSRDAAVVKEIYNWFINEEDTGLHTVAKRLTDMQIPSPREKRFGTSRRLREYLRMRLILGSYICKQWTARG